MESPTVERGFMKNLKNLDRRLGVKFNGDNFVITYDRGYGEPVNLHMVKRDDGGFRQPDMRDMKVIYDGDMTNKKPELELAKRAYELLSVREESKRKSKEAFRDMTKDDRIQLMNAFQKAHGVGKNKAAFRPIKHKPKGQVF